MEFSPTWGEKMEVLPNTIILEKQGNWLMRQVKEHSIDHLSVSSRGGLSKLSDHVCKQHSQNLE